MERLTQRRNDTPVPNKALGDLCWRMSFCEEFEFCEGCPVGKLINRLCEYEETGLTPNDIEKLKKSANIKRCQRKGIVGIPKSGKIITYGCSGEMIAKAIKEISKLSHRYQY